MLNGLEKALVGVSKEWKAEKRQADRQDRLSRSQVTWLSQRPPELSIKEAAYEVMEQAYREAAGHIGTANARQVMYKARPLVLKLTNGRCWKKSSYFTQHLLPDYMAEHQPDWDVAFDARGHFAEPHTGQTVDLGTREVRRYTAGWHGPAIERPSWAPSYAVPTKGPTHRFSAALFLEKEGFNELLSAANIAERFDLAIMSTKGVSVTAARSLVEHLSAKGVQVLVAHDFDKAGFSIVGTLQRDTRRYHFAGRPNVIDIGLRLEDVEGLDSEPVDCDEDDADNLRENGATEEEIDFLTNGERVELNAMDSDQFIEWLEGKLEENGVEKVVPEEEVLAQAYRRAVQLTRAEKAVAETLKKLKDDEIAVPVGLVERVKQELDEYDGQAWDDAVADLAKDDGP